MEVPSAYLPPKASSKKQKQTMGGGGYGVCVCVLGEVYFKYGCDEATTSCCEMFFSMHVTMVMASGSLM